MHVAGGQVISEDPWVRPAGTAAPGVRPQQTWRYTSRTQLQRQALNARHKLSSKLGLGGTPSTSFNTHRSPAHPTNSHTTHQRPPSASRAPAPTLEPAPPAFTIFCT